MGEKLSNIRIMDKFPLSSGVAWHCVSPLGRVGGRQMISQIVEFALFFLVLFFLVPGLMICIGLMRGYTHQHPKPEPGKLTG
jgi:hypothetical protein